MFLHNRPGLSSSSCLTSPALESSTPMQDALCRAKIITKSCPPAPYHSSLAISRNTVPFLLQANFCDKQSEHQASSLQTSGQDQGHPWLAHAGAAPGQTVAEIREPGLGLKLETSKELSSQEQQYSWEQCDALLWTNTSSFVRALTPAPLR